MPAKAIDGALSSASRQPQRRPRTLRRRSLGAQGHYVLLKPLAARGKFPDWSGEVVAGEHGRGLIGGPFPPIRIVVASVPFAGKPPHPLDRTHVALGLA